jgi:hypothetical protein
MIVIPEFSGLWVAVIWITLEKVDRTLLADDGGCFTADEVESCQCKDDNRSKATNDTSYKCVRRIFKEPILKKTCQLSPRR